MPPYRTTILNPDPRPRRIHVENEHPNCPNGYCEVKVEPGSSRNIVSKSASMTVAQAIDYALNAVVVEQRYTVDFIGLEHLRRAEVVLEQVQKLFALQPDVASNDVLPND